MSEMVERVTEAVAACRIDAYGTDEDIARTAIEAMQEPTRAMIDAADKVGIDQDPMDYWRAMIDAALAETE